MLRLTLVRHAKAVAARDRDTDFDRALSAEGLAEAREMAARFASHGRRPQLIVSSPAPRASNTATLFAQAWTPDVPAIDLQSPLYLAGPDALLDAIHALAAHEHVMIVGHNPGISELARRIAGQPLGDLATAAVLQLEFAVAEWRSIGTKEPSQIDLEAPGVRA